MNKKGFTLIELLAAIVILALILAIAIPAITNLTKTSTASSFESSARLLLNTIKLKVLENSSLDPTSINETNLSTIGLSNNDFETVTISKVNNENYIYAKGKNKMNGWSACGTYQNLMLFSSTVSTDCSIYNFDYTGEGKTFVVSKAGNYQMELWGAQGGNISYGGKGGYSKGTVTLNAGQILYVYVGQQGILNNTSSTFNGGGGAGLPVTGLQGAYSGGGASDVRLNGGSWNDLAGLRSRIIVAGGGGGAGIWQAMAGGYAGGLIGGNGYKYNSGNTIAAGTQTTGCGFGYGCKGVNAIWYGCGAEGKGGGGGGYYGGSAQLTVGTDSNASGSGGSSFISGYAGCDAIDASGIHTGQPNHYSGVLFANTQMISGNEIMTSPTGVSETGHAGNGYVRITYLGV